MDELESMEVDMRQAQVTKSGAGVSRQPGANRNRE